MKKRVMFVLLPTLMMLLIVSVAAAAGGRPFSTELLGANEVPGPGDPDGSGTAWLTMNPGHEEVCFDIMVSDIMTPTGAHIHEGDATVAGPVVISFELPTNGLSGCVDADRSQILDIFRNPDQYYVNVHNDEFPAGAVRGQLSR